MAGRKITRNNLKYLHEINESKNLDERIFEAVENGASYHAIVKGNIESLKDFKSPITNKLNWRLFYQWLDEPTKNFPNGKRNELSRIRENYQEERSFELAEEVLKIADESDIESSTAQMKTKNQMDARKWLASSYNQQFRANKQQTNIQININDLHKQALKDIEEI